MKLTNNEIYTMANMIQPIAHSTTIQLPIKANFFLQKNAKMLAAAAKEIDEARVEIGKRYGEYDKNTSMYNIPNEKMEDASKALEELFNIEQELDVKKIKIEDLGDASFTPAQMQVLMFMIDDED